MIMTMELAAAGATRRFGKYTLVAKLATGGMAEIFLARLHGDGGFEKLVCIKRILPHLARDPQFVAMFLDEARVAARISHPNVCQVFELGELGGQYYLAMEYLEGMPLACFRRLDYYPTRPAPRLVAGFGVQACEGLHHAHQLKRADGSLLGVVHRDISPQNLFATVDGIVKVLDFGIAKVQDASVRTSTGAVKGTYAYMAPEQLRNEQLDRRVDVWAMGAVLWETLAQRHLFKRDTEFLTFEAITREQIPDIRELRPDVPPLLGDTIARALSRDRDARFANARALGEALAQAVAPLGGPLTAAAISDEVCEAFAAPLAEQRMLLQIAREGGQFDLDAESPLVGHGTQLATTPISSLQRRDQAAQAEVSQFAAATEAIEALVEEEHQHRPRPRSEGAFTPAPSRLGRSSALEAQPERRSQPHAVQRRSSPHLAAEPYPVAPREWRHDETEPPFPAAPTTSPHPIAPSAASRLPWIIALVAVALAAAAAMLLYLKMREGGRPAGSVAQDTRVVMSPQPSAAAEPSAPAEPAPDPSPPVDPPPAPSEETPVAAPEADVPRVAPARGEVRPSKRVPKPGKAPPAGDDKDVASAPGFITIDSVPVYAVIFINGKKYGETPLVHIKLPPGKHQVKAVSPSGATRTMSIQIESGKTAPVRRIEW
jgi:eukaryotic-like serine/threonine-protein kinase